MIVRTKRFKLDKPIAFTDDFEIRMVVGSGEFIVSNGIDTAIARPVSSDEVSEDEHDDRR